MTDSPKLPPPTTTPPTIPIDFPYKWDDISSKLLLTNPKEIPKFILSPSFLCAWTDYRDLLPLQPSVSIPIIAPKDKDAMTEFVTNIYNMMDGMATCRYDRPTLNDRKGWSSGDFMECLVYQCARDLARPGHTFYSSFERKNLKN